MGGGLKLRTDIDDRFCQPDNVFQLDSHNLLPRTSTARKGRGRACNPPTVPFSFDYKNLNNKNNVNLVHPLLIAKGNGDFEQLYMKQLLAVFDKLPVVDHPYNIRPKALDSEIDIDMHRNEVPDNTMVS